MDVLLEQCLQSPDVSKTTPQTAPQTTSKTPGDTDVYHIMIRQALIDWGDYIIDTLEETFRGDTKISKALEQVREEILGPLRMKHVA